MDLNGLSQEQNFTFLQGWFILSLLSFLINLYDLTTLSWIIETINAVSEMITQVLARECRKMFHYRIVQNLNNHCGLMIFIPQ